MSPTPSLEALVVLIPPSFPFHEALATRSVVTGTSWCCSFNVYTTTQMKMSDAFFPNTWIVWPVRTCSVCLTSCAGMTCHAQIENLLSQNCNILSVSSTFKYNPGKTNNKFVSFLSSDVDTDELKKESDESLCTIWVARYGPQLVASANG